MSGQGLAGFFASVAMICAIASKSCYLSACRPGGCGEEGTGPASDLTPSAPGGSELSESAFGYFITACGVIILTIICYLGLPRLVSTRTPGLEFLAGREGVQGSRPRGRNLWEGEALEILLLNPPSFP